METGIIPFCEEIDRDLLIPIKDLEDCIKETVKGQDELIESIATSIYDSIYMGIKCVELIIGGSGTGKTLTMECFCKELGMAYTIENATQYTQEGYVGESVNKMLSNLFKNSDEDFVRAENGILIIDEIGKKTTKGRGSSDGRDISGEGVIDSLLPILSGAPMNIKVKNRDFQFNTKNLKIFLMDACSGLDEVKNKRAGKKTIGFKVDDEEEEVKSPEKCIYTKDDLIEYGFTPEFMGRINGIHMTNPMNQEILTDIIKKSNTSVFTKYSSGLKKMGIDLRVHSKFFEEVAGTVLGYTTGARELENTIKYVFKNVMHEVYNSKDIKRIHLCDGISEDNTRYKIFYK